MSIAPKERLLGDLLAEAGLAASVASPGFNPPIKQLAVDSRAVAPGTCFIALKGSRVDGHDYIDEAVKRGASAVIVEAGRVESPAMPLVCVANSHRAVARLAAAFYGVMDLQRRDALTLVGVTGTNGKTTVCTLIRAILRAAGLQTAGLGTIVNEIGDTSTPSNMTTLPPIALCEALATAHQDGATHAVMEVSSHALDQKRCDGLDFRVGVFTNLSRDHLDYHGDMDAYAAAKRRLFQNLSPNAHAVIGVDSLAGDPSIAESMVDGCNASVLRFTVGSTHGDVVARDVRVDNDAVHFVIEFADARIPITTSLIGMHNVANITAAVSAGIALDVEPDTIRQGIESVTCVPGRLERVAGAAPFDVLVDYAHTPDALDNVLRILRRSDGRRVICVFGCGGDRDRGKRPEMARAVARYADTAVLTTDNPRSEDPMAIIDDAVEGLRGSDGCTHVVEPDRHAAIERAIDLAEPGDVVLIAGKGHECYQEVAGQKHPFDDVAVARKVLAGRFGESERRVAS